MKWTLNVNSSSINNLKSPCSNSFCLQFYVVSNLFLFHQRGYLLLCIGNRILSHKKVPFFTLLVFPLGYGTDPRVVMFPCFESANSHRMHYRHKDLSAVPWDFSFLHRHPRQYLIFTFTDFLLLYKNGNWNGTSVPLWQHFQCYCYTIVTISNNASLNHTPSSKLRRRYTGSDKSDDQLISLASIWSWHII